MQQRKKGRTRSTRTEPRSPSPAPPRPFRPKDIATALRRQPAFEENTPTSARLSRSEELRRYKEQTCQLRCQQSYRIGLGTQPDAKEVSPATPELPALPRQIAPASPVPRRDQRRPSHPFPYMSILSSMRLPRGPNRRSHR